VLLTGGDTELGRSIAEGSATRDIECDRRRRRDDWSRRQELTSTRSFRQHRCGSLEEVAGSSPPPRHHRERAWPHWNSGDPRTYTLADRARLAHRLDATMLSTVLTVQILGDICAPAGRSSASSDNRPRAARSRRSRLHCRTGRGQAATSASGHHGERVASGRAPSRLRRHPHHAAVGGRRDHPAGTVPHHPAARHITADAALSHGALANFG